MKTGRKSIDCRTMPNSTCSVAISGTEDEVMKVAVYHAVKDHGEADNPGLREMIRTAIKDAP